MKEMKDSGSNRNYKIFICELYGTQFILHVCVKQITYSEQTYN